MSFALTRSCRCLWITRLRWLAGASLFFRAVGTYPCYRAEYGWIAEKENALSRRGEICVYAHRPVARLPPT